MRILVYPHAMEVGGSQLNAIELAAAVRDRGHHVAVLSDAGPLVERVRSLGLEHIQGVRVGRRPSLARVRQLGELMRDNDYDIVHGYEWPPILEAWLATRRHAPKPFGTVMSMAVADFLPGGMPLVVGTRQIAGVAERGRVGAVHVMEPPVDTLSNRPGVADQAVGEDLPSMVRPGTLTIVIVSRMVKELKLEGLLTAVTAIGELATRHPVQLVLVGGGAQLGTVAAEAARVNARFVVPVVTLTGEVADPRTLYDAADICIGMGGSALRALAFAKPLIVQGEGGFFETLRPTSLEMFLEQGFYGVDRRRGRDAVQHLIGLLEPLLDEASTRDRLGGWGRDLVVERFSLSAAAENLEGWYADAARETSVQSSGVTLATGRRFAAYKCARWWAKARGRAATDDFNARPA